MDTDKWDRPLRGGTSSPWWNLLSVVGPPPPWWDLLSVVEPPLRGGTSSPWWDLLSVVGPPLRGGTSSPAPQSFSCSSDCSNYTSAWRRAYAEPLAVIGPLTTAFPNDIISGPQTSCFIPYSTIGFGL
ncbi:unnamed protein product [Pleuronectes platessa]|uniref:Uncharacterized protein n=1 Tax=Pleuronectes platessa TaxID=8262 RepID=A0A9N7YL25_PLEPL|nr:unnamed protein product [Pleuronectes platessa]